MAAVTAISTAMTTIANGNSGIEVRLGDGAAVGAGVVVGASVGIDTGVESWTMEV